MKSLFFFLLAFAGLASTGLHAQEAIALPSLTEALADEPMASTLSAALEAADFTTTLDAGSELILLAPTDDAFDALPEDVMTALMKSENVDVLRSILANHVVDGDSAVAADKLAMGESAAQKQIETGNGVIYLIDKVLIPEGFDPADLE